MGESTRIEGGIFAIADEDMVKFGEGNHVTINTNVHRIIQDMQLDQEEDISNLGHPHQVIRAPAKHMDFMPNYCWILIRGYEGDG